MSTTPKILTRAADRLEKQGAWTQHAMAKDADGTQVPSINSGACQWCSVGAIRAETQDRYQQHLAEIALGKTIGTQLITTWNDHPARDQEEIVAAFRKAAQEAAK